MTRFRREIVADETVLATLGRCCDSNHNHGARGSPWLSLLSKGNALKDRLICRKRLIVMHAGPRESDPGSPYGAALIRITPDNAAADAPQAVAAMREAGEAVRLVAERLAQGDEFIGWQVGHSTACFGWITHGERSVGPLRLTSRPSTVYLYNFHTAAWAARRGLYTSLLARIRHLLGMSGINDFIIDANERNLPSIRGMHSAGFRQIATVSFLTVCDRWNIAGSLVPLSPADPILNSIVR